MTAVAWLERILTSYEPAAPQEVVFRERMLALSATGARAFSRDVYEPGHFTASAFVLSPDGGSLLLILHRKLGLWLQPGGHVEPTDADLVTTARRELLEEVGLDSLALERDGIFDVDIHDIPALPDAPAHQHFDVRFLFRAPSLACRAGSDARDARWVALEDVASVGSDGSVMRAAHRLLGNIAGQGAKR